MDLVRCVVQSWIRSGLTSSFQHTVSCPVSKRPSSSTELTSTCRQMMSYRLIMLWKWYSNTIRITKKWKQCSTDTYSMVGRGPSGWHYKWNITRTVVWIYLRPYKFTCINYYYLLTLSSHENYLLSFKLFSIDREKIEICAHWQW